MQGIHLRKYGVQATIDFELYEQDGLKFRTDAVSATGDINLVRDGANEEELDADAFVDEGRSYSLVLSAAEMTAARIIVYVVDQDATQIWLDKAILIETYGHASAQHAFDFGSAAGDTTTIQPAGYLGDFELGDTVTFTFSTSGTFSADGNGIKVFKDDSDDALVSAGVTLEKDFGDAGSETVNVHQVTIALTDANYDKGANYQIILNGATIGGATVTGVVATLSIENRYAKPSYRQVAR